VQFKGHLHRFEIHALLAEMQRWAFVITHIAKLACTQPPVTISSWDSTHSHGARGGDNFDLSARAVLAEDVDEAHLDEAAGAALVAEEQVGHVPLDAGLSNPARQHYHGRLRSYPCCWRCLGYQP